MPYLLSDTEKSELLKIARDAIKAAVFDKPFESLELNALSKNLQTDGASFVTLTIDKKLRGCIGALEAYQPLAVDVQEHAAAAALEDYRFPPVTPEEIPLIKIEISWLTPLKQIEYVDTADLTKKLRPEIDGVLIRDGARRATFLPQVWEQIGDANEFLSRLCMKMGARPDLWQNKHLAVFIYQVIKFEED